MEDDLPSKYEVIVIGTGKIFHMCYITFNDFNIETFNVNL